MDNQYNQNNGSGGATFGVLAFVFGIVSLVMGIICDLPTVLVALAVMGALYVVPILSLILGVLAVVFSSMAKKAGNMGGLRKGGFVLGIIGIVFAVIALIEIAVCNMAVNNAINDVGQAITENMEIDDVDLEELQNQLEDLFDE